MESFTDYLSKPASSSAVEQVDMIWAMAFVSLVSNKYHIILPSTVATTVGAWGIKELKHRLSQFLDEAPTVAYRDVDADTIRICRASDYEGPSTSSTPFGTPAQVSSSPMSPASSTDAVANSRAATPEKKSKVPRPPNAFILYRKHHHPLLKEKNPDMHNNDISVILGKQWNGESEKVKNEYRARAEKIKRKHAVDNPGYQYAPRKPTEKKRRMTARKLTQLGFENAGEHLNYVMSLGQSPSAAESIGVARASQPGYLSSLTDEPSDISVILPAPQEQLQQQSDVLQNLAQPEQLLSFDDELQQSHLIASPAQSTQNDQAFMNSLIDWNGVRRDAALVFGATLAEAQDLATVEYGDTQLELLATMNDEEFHAELDRLTRMI